MTETWQEQSVEMTSMSMPNVEYGRSNTQQGLNVSRMSAGFADVSQLADEEKEKLDFLIERLEEERRRMMATTELLTSTQTPTQIEQSPKEKERERLKTELKGIRNYNRELERELIELRACLHPGSPPRSSTPQTKPLLNNHAPLSITQSPDFTEHGIYHTPQTTPAKQTYDGFYSPDLKKYDTPPSGQHSPYGSPQIVPRHYVESATPHFERLKNGDSPVLRPHSLNSHEYPGLSPKASRMPMKAPRHIHRSLGNSPTQLNPKSPGEFPERSYRSLGNSPKTVEPEFGNSPNVGPWGSRKVLPDAPKVKSYLHESPYTPPPDGTKRQLSNLSQGGRSPTNFYREHPTYNASSENSSLSDVSHKSEQIYFKTRERRGSDNERSFEDRHRSSKSLQEAYQRHLVAAKSASETSMLTKSHQTHLDSSSASQGQLVTPKPRERHKRSATPQRVPSKTNSKIYENDSSSDTTSNRGRKCSTKNAKSETQSPNRSSSRRFSKDRKPTPHKRIHATEIHHSSDSIKSTTSSFEQMKQRPQVSKSNRRDLKKRPSDLKLPHPSEVSNDSNTRNEQDRPSQFSHSDTQGSLAPPRQVTSHENLAFEGSHPGSMDSLDTLHGGASNPSMGVYGTSHSGTTPSNSPCGSEIIAEFDPYAHIHSSDPTLPDKRVPQRELIPTREPNKNKRPSPKVIQSHIESSSVPRDLNPELSAQSSVSDISRHKDIQTHKHPDTTTQESSHISTNSTSSQSELNDSKHGTSYARRSPVSGTPVKEKHSNSKAIETRDNSMRGKKKRKKKLTSDGDSSDARTTPEGDVQIKSEHSLSERSFTSPEEEMKFLVNKLQGIMPSVHDHPTTETRSSIDLKEVMPMSEVLVAAQQTKQAIRLFTEYAIAVAAGEV